MVAAPSRGEPAAAALDGKTAEASHYCDLVPDTEGKQSATGE